MLLRVLVGGKETLLTPYAALGKSEFRFKKGGLYKEVDLFKVTAKSKSDVESRRVQ